MKRLSKLKARQGIVDAATRIASSLETMLAMAREERRKEAAREARHAAGTPWTILVELRSGVVLVASGSGPQQVQVRFLDYTVGPRKIAWERRILTTWGYAVGSALGIVTSYGLAGTEAAPPPTPEELAKIVAVIEAERPRWNAIASVEVHGDVSVGGLRLDCQADILQGATVPAHLVQRLAAVWLEATDVVIQLGGTLHAEIESC